MSRTGGQLKETLYAAALTAGKLQELLHPHLHPKAEEKMVKGGFFPKLANILSFANKAYSVIDKAIPIATKGYKAYGQIKKGIDEMKKPEGGNIEYTPMMSGINNIQKAGELKSKRKLPEALRKRAEFIGKHMKNGKMTMKTASEMYKQEQNK